MFRASLVVLALVASTFSQTCAERDFITKCSLSAPDLEQCFVRNGNIAIEVLSSGVDDLDIPPLHGFDIGDEFFKLKEDLSFLLEDAKLYPTQLRLENAKLNFSHNKTRLRSMELAFGLADVYWTLKYRALGFLNNRKIKEKGLGRINFGSFRGNYTADLKREQADGQNFLKVVNHQGVIEYDKFEFISSEVKAVGDPLQAEHFQQMESVVAEKAVQVGMEIVTYTFNQILQEIPENQLFLP